MLLIIVYIVIGVTVAYGVTVLLIHEVRERRTVEAFRKNIRAELDKHVNLSIRSHLYCAFICPLDINGVFDNIDGFNVCIMVCSGRAELVTDRAREMILQDHYIKHGFEVVIEYFSAIGDEWIDEVRRYYIAHQEPFHYVEDKNGSNTGR